MRPSSLLLTCALALSLTGGAVRAQDAPAPTLAQALAALEAPKHDLFLTVGADKVRLPPDAPPPDPDSRPGPVGDAYGRLARDFGGVTALAPPTMVVLNTRPGVPDPYEGLPASEALKLLLAGLNPSQWDALTGETGLGLGDLSDDGQRSLFRATLPAAGVAANPEFNSFIPAPSSTSVTPAARDLAAARLRLGRRMEIEIPVTGQTRTSAGYRPGPVANETSYDVNSAPVAARETVYGATLREIVPNCPKDADLDYDAASLKQSIGVEGIATVGDLVARVGRAAGLELYVDRRYETRRVMLVGRRTARGVDLLRAVAFCVTGTFRRVGPAYVLTDDLQGTATRRQRLTRFVQQAEMMRHAAVEAAGDSLATARGGTDALPWLGGLGFSDVQQSLPQFNHSLGGGLTVPFAHLTPAQQDYVLALARQVASSGDTRLDMGGQFTLQSLPHLLLLSPAVPGPFFLEYFDPYRFFQPSIKFQMEQMRREEKEVAQGNLPPAAPRPVPPPALAAALAPIPRRAVLAAPRTAAEVDSVVASMKKIGLNQLWLDVFSGGHSRLGKSNDGGGDILTEALARTKGTDIVVIPALDLLPWGSDTPSEARDLTAMGETSDRQQAWSGRYYNAVQNESGVVYTPSANIWVCPAAPIVEETLIALVRRLASTPGVTTLALRDTVPTGYNHPPGSDFGLSDGDLGYTAALRLALLRRDHVDPVDLDRSLSLPDGADVSLPDFEPAFGDAEGINLNQAFHDWNHLRDTASRDLLRHLLAAAQEASGRQFRFVIQQRGDTALGNWYGLWENSDAPLPELPAVPPGHNPLLLPWEINGAPIAHSQCRIALYALPPWAAAWPYSAADVLRKLKPGWDGVVMEAGSARLARLAQSLTPITPQPVP